jgi:hypothetical protein
VIFFSLGVNGVVELLGHVKAVYYRLGVLQFRLTGFAEGRTHVHAKRLYLGLLRFAQLVQTGVGRRFVFPFKTSAKTPDWHDICAQILSVD